MHSTRSNRGARQRPRRWMATLAVTAIVLSACGPAADQAVAQQSSAAPAASPSPTTDPVRDLFAYDRTGAVEVTDVGVVEDLDREIRDITYPSPKGGDVPAYIAEPDEPSDVGVLMIPGMPEKRHPYTDPLARFACAGATAMVIDAPWARDPERTMDDALTFETKDRDEQIQLIVDARRAIDVLEQAGADTIGFDAISYGAVMGAQLAGVDDRIDAYGLMSADSGMVDHFNTPEGDPLFPLSSLPRTEQQKWIEAMTPIEPVNFVGDATAPMLFVNGREDIYSQSDGAKALHEAAGDNAEVRWYDAGHELNVEAFDEHLDWLADQIGLDQDRVDECFEGAW